MAVISPLAGAIAGKAGLRPVMVPGLAMQAAGFTWVCVRGGPGTSWIELTFALLVAGIGISMALPAVPAAVLGAVRLQELGKASGINYMTQQLGQVLAVAIGTSVFTAYGHLGTPASVTAGFKPALIACTVFAVLATLTAAGTTARNKAEAPEPETAQSLAG